MSHVRNNYDPQGVFKDHRRDRYGQLVIGIVTRRPRIVFPTWEVHGISSETMNPWNSVRGFHGMPVKYLDYVEFSQQPPRYIVSFHKIRKCLIQSLEIAIFKYRTYAYR